MNITVKKAKKLTGNIEIPSDKSITHRALIIGSILKGQSIKIYNYSKSKDCLSTINAVLSIGCEIIYNNDNSLTLTSNQKIKTTIPQINCENSGTTIRLLAGVLCGNSNTILIGDQSLSKRPMKRIIEPLKLMGAKIDHNNFCAPLKITQTNLYGIDYKSKVASAQVKSCVLLAGLFSKNKTIYQEPFISRNHTENMLKYFGANIEIKENKVIIEKSDLIGKNISVPGDFSSAAYFIAAALIIPGSKIYLKNILINETRVGFINILKKMGGIIKIENIRYDCNEKVGDIYCEYSELTGINVDEKLIANIIDEIPILSVVASCAKGITTIKNASELKYKESDRLSAIYNNLRKLRVNVEIKNDDIVIEGPNKFYGDVELESYNDHRIAMSSYVIGLICENPIKINNFQWVDISFPTFLKLFDLALVN